MEIDQQRLMEFLESSFDPEGIMHFLAVSAVPTALDGCKQEYCWKVRVALTFKEGESVIPYFDGTDVCVAICPSGIRFANEHEWADGPPIMEGSPNELALKWVSELTKPFWVSDEARAAASRGLGGFTCGDKGSEDDSEQAF